MIIEIHFIQINKYYTKLHDRNIKNKSVLRRLVITVSEFFLIWFLSGSMEIPKIQKVTKVVWKDNSGESMMH